jgi:hypothetical protein
MGRVPDATHVQASTPYDVASSSTSDAASSPLLTPDAAAEFLYGVLTTPDRHIPTNRRALVDVEVLRLLTTSLSPGPNPQAYSPALCSALEAWVANLENTSAASRVTAPPLWFLAAVMQLRLQEAAGDDAGLHQVLLSQGVVEDAYLR